MLPAPAAHEMRIEPHAAFQATSAVESEKSFLSAVESEKWVSRIVFRDPPKVTRNDLREGKAWARKVLESFDA